MIRSRMSLDERRMLDELSEIMTSRDPWRRLSQRLSEEDRKKI
jgi:hypothetical protein